MGVSGGHKEFIILQSMTGFARVDTKIGDLNVTWEARSVNGKGLDVKFRSTTLLDVFENELKKKAAAVFARGSITFSLTITSPKASNIPVVNREYISYLINLSAELEKEYNIAKSSLAELLAIKGVIEHDSENCLDTLNDECRNAINMGFERVLLELVASRKAEGNSLEQILTEQINQLEILVKKARNDPARSLDAIRERLKTTVEALLETNAPLDPQRLHIEAAFIATKVDVQEELDRLDGHIKAARSLISSEQPIGRRLDFLAQEFNREANTLCSKAHTTSLTEVGLGLKTVIDQLREQIQNIE